MIPLFLVTITTPTGRYLRCVEVETQKQAVRAGLLFVRRLPEQPHTYSVVAEALNEIPVMTKHGTPASEECICGADDLNTCCLCDGPCPCDTCRQEAACAALERKMEGR